MTQELLRGGEVAPHAHVGVVHILSVAIIYTSVVAIIPILPLLHLRSQVVLVAHHLDLLVQPVQLLPLRVADGRLDHHRAIPNGHDVRRVALHQHAFLLHHVLVLVRHRVDELFSQSFQFVRKDGFNLRI